MVAAPPIVRPAPPPLPPAAGAVLGVMSIPSLGLRVMLVQGGEDLTTKKFPVELDHAVAHYPTTALPWQQGTVLVSGHRTTWDKPFARINTLRKGQAIVVDTPRYGRFMYLVSGMRIVRPTDLSFARWRTGRMIALSACHPPGLATFRIVVLARLASWRR